MRPLVFGRVERRRSHWGWGYEDDRPAPAEVRAVAAAIPAHLGFPAVEVEEPAALASVTLPDPRVEPPPGDAYSTDPHDRAVHHYGRGYRDVVRAFRGEFDHPPDVVAHPADEREVEEALAWAADADLAVVPFGGGTSVVGGVELADPGPHAGVLSLDLSKLDGVLEVDERSRAARIQAGANGPRLEAQLAERGLTMRFYPQSFELSTLGGWIATRAGGHFATGPTHVDDLVESVRAVTPAGVWASRRLPGSGAGPAPDRLLLGSEGTLGVITEAWVRVRPRPIHRASAGVSFGSFAAGAEAVRALAQSGLEPANCRLIDAREAKVTGAGDGAHALLVVGFESADHPVDAWAARARELCEAAGGTWEDRAGAAGAWREAFLRAPYLRDTLIAAGVFSETVETAITWERFPGLHAAVTGAVEEALGGAGFVTCRFTHAYSDGPAAYFTILAPARRGDELAQWDELKRAASAAVMAAGGTITHHHAVGRDHRPWYDVQRPDPFAAALRAAKAAVDPDGRLNPGVLVDPA
jgi:alkyldihydroxyacetonephosphate synthase